MKRRLIISWFTTVSDTNVSAGHLPRQRVLIGPEETISAVLAPSTAWAASAPQRRSWRVARGAPHAARGGLVREHRRDHVAVLRPHRRPHTHRPDPFPAVPLNGALGALHRHRTRS